MINKRLTILNVHQACIGGVEKLEDASKSNLNKEAYSMFAMSDLFVVFDATHYRILKDRYNNFLSDRKIPVTLLAEEIQDYLKDENHV